MPKSQTPVDYAKRGDIIWKMHNAIRGNAKLTQLGWSARLERAAQKHAAWMAENANLSHTGKDNSSVGQRTKAEGFTWGLIAENIAMGQTTCKEVMVGWMHSPGHHKNIHLADITTMGAACIMSVEGDRQTPYWCVVFGRQL